MTAIRLKGDASPAPGTTMPLLARRIFGLDSAGALLTAFLLAIVLAIFEEWFGMPHRVLYVLSTVACLYALYSACCYYSKPRHWRFYLKLIAIANLLYSCLTIGLVAYHYHRLTALGLLYFILELLLMLALAGVELRIASRPVHKS